MEGDETGRLCLKLKLGAILIGIGGWLEICPTMK
jgi:hypothetical protein